jgi:hypothetical protein
MFKRAMLAGILPALAALALFSCNSASEPSDEENLRAKIDGEYAAYFNDGTTMSGGNNGGGFDLGTGGGRDATATLPVAWWRELDYSKRTISVTVSAPYTQADVFVKDDIKGDLRVDRSNDRVLNPGSKAIAVYRERYATFERPDTDSPWILTAISPARYSLQVNGRQTVVVTSLRVQSDGGFDRTYNNWKELIPLAELPHFETGEKVTVTAKAHNTSSSGWTPVSFAFLHHPVYVRDNMTDQGNEAYVKEYTIGDDTGVHHAGVDVMDAGTLQNENADDYNGAAWGLPYIIE